MFRITRQTPLPLHSVAATRRMEHAAMQVLAAHTLMQGWLPRGWRWRWRLMRA